MNRRRLAWGIANLLLILLAVAASWLIVTKRQDIIDWWRLQGYKPPADIVKIADETGMSPHARSLFYVSDPKIQDREAFNFNCNATAERGRVLGCYTHQNIYLFNVTDPRLAGVLQVTAVHEMLHAAYERLGQEARAWVDNMVSAQAQALSGDKHLQDLIALYQKTEPGEEDNELHSILATEYLSLSPELEAYYTRYFDQNRGKVVAFQKAYNAEFDASQARIDAYQKQLDMLKPRIDVNTADLKRLNQEIEAETERLDALRSTDVAAYNGEVPGFNAKAQEYNRIARETQLFVVQYNDIVGKIKNEIALQTDLNQSLDSQYAPVTTQ